MLTPQQRKKFKAFLYNMPKSKLLYMPNSVQKSRADASTFNGWTHIKTQIWNMERDPKHQEHFFFFFFWGHHNPVTTYKDEQNFIFHLQGGVPSTQTHKIQYLQIPVACLVFPCRQDSSRAEESMAFLLFKAWPHKKTYFKWGGSNAHDLCIYYIHFYMCRAWQQSEKEGNELL